MKTSLLRVWNILGGWVRRSITYEQGVQAGLVTAPTVAGVPVTVESSLTSSPVFAAVRIISTAVASLPIVLFRKLPDGSRDRASDHPVYGLLHDAPNIETDPFVWWAAFVAQLLMHGNGIAEIERDGAGRPIGLWLIPANRTEQLRDNRGELFYLVHTDKGDIPLLAEDVFHVPYFTLDGGWGTGVVKYARDTIGLNKAMEVGAVAQFENMVRPSGAIEAPPGLSETARENIRKSVERSNGGVRKIGRLLFLEDGVKLNPFAVSNQDAQWLEARQFGIQEVARFFSISPTKLGDLGRATWSNLESENLSFIENTLRPILIPIEQQARRKLLGESERRDLFAETVIEARLRGQTADRYSAYSTAINAGFMLPSEARTKENWTAIPGIDDRPRPGQAPPSPPEKTHEGNRDSELPNSAQQ